MADTLFLALISSISPHRTSYCCFSTSPFRQSGSEILGRTRSLFTRNVSSFLSTIRHTVFLHDARSVVSKAKVRTTAAELFAVIVADAGDRLKGVGGLKD